VDTRRQRRISLIAGWGFGCIGLVGLVIPLVPSILFFLIAIVFLAKSKPRFRHLRMTLKRRYPVFLRAFGEAELRAAQIARGEFITSIRDDFRKGKEKRRVNRLMRRRMARARSLGVAVEPDALAYVPVDLPVSGPAVVPVRPAEPAL
jgi:hypothetical protein